MDASLYRNRSLVHVGRYRTAPGQAEDLIEALRRKWAVLRETERAGDFPVEILRSDSMLPASNGDVEVIEVFKWRTAIDRDDAPHDPDYQQLQSEVARFTAGESQHGTYTGAARGFNANFPNFGGVELLQGKCSCMLTIDGYVANYPLEVKNGIVLMHRSPGKDYDGDGVREMILKILMHGGAARHDDLGSFRVEQNFTRPNDGIVKSHGVDGQDFPGTAVWRVAWRIQTELGPLLTDPDVPLVFGPATVSHYPPVGTEFPSSTGPVRLLHEQTGAVVGSLVPGELTAFDIVVTKDDELPDDVLNTMPDDLLDVLGRAIERAGAQMGLS